MLLSGEGIETARQVTSDMGRDGSVACPALLSLTHYTTLHASHMPSKHSNAFTRNTHLKQETVTAKIPRGDIIELQ